MSTKQKRLFGPLLVVVAGGFSAYALALALKGGTGALGRARPTERTIVPNKDRRPYVRRVFIDPELKKESPETAVTPRKRPIADIESELITVTPHGFEPREIRRPKGSFLLMIDNRSGFQLVAPRLALNVGAPLRDIQVPREQPNWSEVVDLNPGQYVLLEPGHPNWLCRITITPK